MVDMRCIVYSNGIVHARRMDACLPIHSNKDSAETDMNALERMSQNLVNVKQNIATITMDITETHSDEICDANQLQMQHGLRPNGDYIYPFYEMQYNTYWRFKREPGGEGAGIYNTFDMPQRPQEVPNLGNTGRFYNSLTTVRYGDELYIDAADPKWNNPIAPNHISLHDRYGEVLGIPTEFMDVQLRPIIKEELLIKLKELITK